MKTESFSTKEEAIDAAKKKIEEAYGAIPGDRPWLEASPSDSYDDENYRITVYVLSGSPPKGIILYSQAHRKVMGFNCYLMPMLIYRIDGSTAI